MNGSGSILLLIGVLFIGGIVWFIYWYNKPLSPEDQAELDLITAKHQQEIAQTETARRTNPKSPASSSTERTPIYRSEYLTPEQEQELLTVDQNGIPNFVLRHERGQIVMRIEGHGLVNFRSRTLWRKDIYTLVVRGTSYHTGANSRAETRPGTPVLLKREPANPYDKNAIAIYSGTTPEAGLIGYVNKQNAARLAPRLDAEEQWEGIFLDGSPSGRGGGSPRVLIAHSNVLSALINESQKEER